MYFSIVRQRCTVARVVNLLTAIMFKRLVVRWTAVRCSGFTMEGGQATGAAEFTF